MENDAENRPDPDALLALEPDDVGRGLGGAAGSGVVSPTGASDTRRSGTSLRVAVS